jgi:rod shape-determining protein MreC
MTLRRRLLDYGATALLLALPAVVLRASLADPSHLGAFDEAVLRVSAPLQHGVSWVIEGIGGLWSSYVGLVDVGEENQELRKDNERLRRELHEAWRRSAYTESLEGLVALRRETAAETVGARVIAASVNPHFRVTRIGLDRGDAEVEPGMPVLNAEGLIGRISRVYGGYSDVLLTTDPQSSVDVQVVRTGGRGVLTGLGQDDSYACKIEYLEQGDAVQVGDAVVTSGLGGAFPPGVQVGRIVRVGSHEVGLYQEVVVEPTVDFSDLGRVLVVLAPPPPPDPDAGRRPPSPPAYSLRPYR